jgi:hypothetical protein
MEFIPKIGPEQSKLTQILAHDPQRRTFSNEKQQNDGQQKRLWKPPFPLLQVNKTTTKKRCFCLRREFVVFWVEQKEAKFWRFSVTLMFVWYEVHTYPILKYCPQLH